MSPNSDRSHVAWTEEPAAYDDTYGRSISKPETELRLWDEDEWAMNILNQGFVDPSRSKLDRRVKEFLMLANPTEKEGLEAGRSKMVVVLQEAQREFNKKYSTTTAEAVQSRRQIYKTKVRDACRAFTEGAYEYSKIMDMLAGQVPEYVALVWGAIKIILIVQINHEELKQKIHEHIKLIKSKFEIMDHLTVLLPRANLVAAIARSYELFSRFLAKSVKYYSMNRFKATWKAFSKPWKADLQSLVDEISQTFEHVKDISQFHSLLEAHATQEIGRLNLHNSTESKKIQEQSLAKLSELESMMERIQTTILRFSKERDIQQTANYLRQHICEDLQVFQPASLSGPRQRQDLDDGPLKDVQYDFEVLKEEFGGSMATIYSADLNSVSSL
ncbi:FAD-dependent monooxygenase [Physcia stellaris]|nr:FAD-dependent monooxygenase [Physcia stellaris]